MENYLYIKTNIFTFVAADVYSAAIFILSIIDNTHFKVVK